MGRSRSSTSGDHSVVAPLLRLVVSVAAPVVVLVLAAWWLVADAQTQDAVAQRAAMTSDLVRIALDGQVGVTPEGVAVADPDLVDDRLATVLAPVLGPDTSVRLVSFDGVALYSTIGAEIGEITGLGDMDPGATSGIATGAILDERAGAMTVAYSVPVTVAGATVAAALVLVPHDDVVAAAADRADRLIYLFGGAALAIVVAVVPLAWWSLGQARRQFRQTRVLAMSDTLTGLPNRMQFHQRLDEAIAGAERSGESVGLIMVDLDGFKAINDTGGHAAGDRLLRRVAAALDDATRRNEVACRLGGDEFAVLAPRIGGREELTALADRLHERLDLNVDFSDGRKLRVTASLGLALFPDDAQCADDLLNTADVGMYTVKAARRAKLPPEVRERAGVGR